MKYVIYKTELKTSGHEPVILREEIVTNDIEKTRKELHQAHRCDRVLFHYNEVEE